MEGGKKTSHLVCWDNWCHQDARNCTQTWNLAVIFLTFPRQRHSTMMWAGRQLLWVAELCLNCAHATAAGPHKEIKSGWKKPLREASVHHPSFVRSPRKVSFLKMFSSTNVNRGDPAPSLLSSSLLAAAPSPALPCSRKRNRSNSKNLCTLLQPPCTPAERSCSLFQGWVCWRHCPRAPAPWPPALCHSRSSWGLPGCTPGPAVMSCGWTSLPKKPQTGKKKPPTFN